MRTSLILLLICCFSLCEATDSTNFWNRFLPEQQIDSIRILRARDVPRMSVTKQDSLRLSKEELHDYGNEVKSHNQQMDALFHSRTCDPKDYQEYLKVFEKQFLITSKDQVIETLEHFPKIKCEGPTGSVSRCLPVYRDLVFFYAEGELVYYLKICFSCKHITDGGDDNQKSSIQCLTNEIEKLAKFYIQKGYIDLYDY